MTICKKIELVGIKDAIDFNCNGSNCSKKLGEIDPETGYLYQQSKRWHFMNIIKQGIIRCQCGWQFEYKYQDFKQEE